MTASEWERAERIAKRAGFRSKRMGACLWCWRDGEKSGRYVDVAGLFDAERPADYVRGCMVLGGMR